MVEATVVMRRPDGSLLPAGTELTVAQRRHAFLFGSTGFDAIPLVNGELDGADRERLERIYWHWFDLFNAVTLPFYWRRFELRQGEPDTKRLAATARWFRARGITTKGHPLTWHTLAPEWLLDLPTSEVERLQRARIGREVTGFADLIDSWDAINEAVIMPRFVAEENGITRLAQGLGRVGMVRLAFEEARAANQSATLLINDFDLSEEYETLIGACLDAGIAIDAIGIQSHMHQGYWGEERTAEILERYSRFDLPLHWTETTILSGHLMPPEIVDLNDYRADDWPSTPEGEARQADEAVRHYRTLFAHPAVAAITWWDPADGAWLNAPAGLLRKDGSPKPAFDALLALVKGEWWLPPTRVSVEAEGRVRLRAMLGTYAISDGSTSADVEILGAEPGAVTLGGRLGENPRQHPSHEEGEADDRSRDRGG
jgi:GH35 family endo-1,4-beta-xylanase